MIDADALHEAEQQALGQLAQMDLSLATHLHAEVLNAEDIKAKMDLVRAYARVSRCVRQTIMLRAKLRHDRERHIAATTPAGRGAFAPLFGKAAPDRDAQRIDTRIMALQKAASHIIAEASPDMVHAERLDALDRIDAWIDREVDDKDDDFGLQDLDAHVLELCRACELPEDLGRRFRELYRAPWEAETGAYAFEPPSEPAAEPVPEPGRRDTG